MSIDDRNDNDIRVAFRDRFAPLLDDVAASSGQLLDGIRGRQRRRNRVTAAIGGVAVAAAVAGAVVVMRPPVGSARPLAPSVSSTSPATTSAAPLPGPTLSANTVVVPDVRGLSLPAATALLEAAGLSAEDVELTTTETEEIVLTQDPVAGSEVATGSRVRLTVQKDGMSVSFGGPTPTAALPSGSSAPLGAEGALLPDGSRLPSECSLPQTQDSVPSPDDTFLAYDQCGGGQFSLTTGRSVRYVSAAGLATFTVDPAGDVFVEASPPACAPARVLVAGAHYVTAVAGAGSATTQPVAFSHSATGTAWAEETCGDGRVTASVVIRDTSTHVLPFDRGLGSPFVQWTALSNDGRLAVTYDRSAGTTDCPLMTGGGCPNIVNQGIAIVTANSRSVPAPQLRPGPQCEFRQVAWSGADLVALEWCDGPRGTRLDYPSTMQLVRLDATTGKRLSATDLPTDWGQLVDGLRALSDGDVLVSTGSAKYLEHLLRLKGAVATELNVPRCSACSWAAMYP